MLDNFLIKTIMNGVLVHIIFLYMFQCELDFIITRYLFYGVLIHMTHNYG